MKTTELTFIDASISISSEISGLLKSKASFIFLSYKCIKLGDKYFFRNKHPSSFNKLKFSGIFNIKKMLKTVRKYTFQCYNGKQKVVESYKTSKRCKLRSCHIRSLFICIQQLFYVLKKK